MDKQQAAREFEEWHKNEYGSGPYVAPITYGERNAWQAAQAAIMPALVEARDAFRAIETTGLNNVCSGLDSKHVRDHNITVAQNALARINAIIGDKK